MKQSMKKAYLNFHLNLYKVIEERSFKGFENAIFLRIHL